METEYEWQMTAFKWPSALWLGHKGEIHYIHDKWGALSIDVHDEDGITLKIFLKQGGGKLWVQNVWDKFIKQMFCSLVWYTSTNQII